MKIKLKITTSQLHVLNGEWETYITPRRREERAITSILRSVEKKMRLKEYTKRQEESHVPFSISLLYHEAHFFEQQLQQWLCNEGLDIYTGNVLQQFHNQLNQKLA